MQAVVRRQGKLICDEVAELEPETGQTLVKTLCCGICGSDLHALHHLDHMVELSRRAGGGFALDATKDVVFGHEFCAEVLDHGPDTPQRFKPGTRVVSVPVAFGSQGLEAVGYSNRLPGGFAERMILSEAMLLEVPNGLSNAEAAMTEPFAVGFHAVAQSAMDEDAVAMVVGCGPVGLAVIAALKLKGYGPVIAADFSEARRRMAEKLGADVIVDPAQSSPNAHWSGFGVPATGAERQMAMMSGTPGKRAVIFECVGSPGVLQHLIESAPPTAQLLVAGVCMQPDLIEPFLAIVKQLDFRFVYGYTPEEYAQTLHHIAEGRLAAGSILSKTIGRAQTAEAFEELATPGALVKIVLDPSLA